MDGMRGRMWTAPPRRVRSVAFCAGIAWAALTAAGTALGADGSEATPSRTPDGLIAVGAAAPGFELSDGSGHAVRLKDLLDRPLVLYFYPMDDTPGCTAEACSYRDDSAQFDSLGVRVVGISTDDQLSHRAFAAKHKLPFTLLSDTLAVVSRAYGVAFDIEVAGSTRTIARRVTFLIDRAGVVRHVWPKVDAAASGTEVLAVVRKLLPELKR